MKRLDKNPVLAAIILCAAIPVGYQTATADTIPASTASPHPPIPIRFTLNEPGFVTLVIEDANGNRVRNLVSETEFPAGANTAWWDGLDDLTPDKDAAAHAIFHIAAKLAAPGKYRVRGLVRPKLNLVYRMTADTNGNPAWKTADKASEWLANHTPPSAVLFVPEDKAPRREGHPAPGGQIIVGSFVSEGGSGVAWLDLNGNKVNGQLWLGGVWTGATQIARDEGDKPVPGVYAYTGSAWPGDKYNGNRDELRLHELVAPDPLDTSPHNWRTGTGEDHRLLTPTFKLPPAPSHAIASSEHYALDGLAVRNGLLVAALPDFDQLAFVDAAGHKALGTAPLAEPHGLAFDKRGRLLAISGKTVVRLTLAPNPPQLPAPEVLVAGGLEEPQQIALDATGNMYVSDWGASHQVKVFSPDGKLLRAIGDPGKPAVGPYNPNHMNHPNGVTISGDGHLWVAETDKMPKRISVWTLDGQLTHAYYGPAQYGGGGTVDSLDKSRFFYGDEGGGMEMKLDYDKGTSVPTAIYYRTELNPLGADTSFEATGWNRVPQTPIHLGGRTYLTDCYTSHPTSGVSTAATWVLENGVARPVAAIGRANSTPAFGTNAKFCVRWTGQIVPKYSETCTLQLNAEDGARLWINGQQVINDWKLQNERHNAGTFAFEAGKRYDIKIEYNHTRSKLARAYLSWFSEHQKREIIPREVLFPPGSAETAGTGLQAEYFEGGDFSHLTKTQIDETVNCPWGKQLPAALVTERIKALRARLPDDADLDKAPFMFAWSDLNDNGQMEPEELTFTKGEPMTLCVMPDLTTVSSSGMIFKPERFTPRGAPVYDAAKVIKQDIAANMPGSTGGAQALLARDNSLVLTTAPKPFSNFAIGGVLSNKSMWSYPNLWPGLHASHNAAMPEFSGELIGPTRLLGPPFDPGGEAGELFALNANKGNVYLFTTDGLFVATLFKDCRSASWNASVAKAGLDVSDLSLQEECFWPTISKNTDGIYLQGGAVSNIVRVEGLDKIKRLPARELEISPAMLREASAYFVQSEAQRQAAAKPQGPLTVTVRDKTPFGVNGKLDDWTGANWVTISQRTGQVGDWGHRVEKTEAAIGVGGDRLAVALKTDDPNLLKNSGESLQNLFKTGGCIDLMIGTDANADPNRKLAVAGDERLLVTRVRGKTVAMLYRPVATPLAADEPAEDGETVSFTSPLRTVKIDRVENVSADVTLASVTPAVANSGSTVYEFSIPLSILGLKPSAGLNLRGDIGILSGDGVTTLQRVYWSNKATGITSDLPSEAELTPNLWGRFDFKTLN